MHTVALIAQKGGSGKTTIATNLAVAAEGAGRSTILIDLDPQQSAAAWGDDRDGDTPFVVSGQATRLQAVLDDAREQGADVALLDTAPHHEAAALAAARAADLVLLPVRPALIDLRALVASYELARIVGVRAVAVLNAIPPAGPRADEAAAAIGAHGIQVCPVRIGQRVALVDATNAGRGVLESAPRSRAAGEMQTLYDWLASYLKEIS